MRSRIIFSYALLAACSGNALHALAAQTESTAQPKVRPHAEARIEALDGSGLAGHVAFRHSGAFVFIEATVNGLGPGKHGMHVHEGTSCDKRGGHFNPGDTRHGSPDQPHDMRHVGDLGNIVALEGGTAKYSRVDALARLSGPHSVVGRVLVVHQGEDDYVSQPSGNSGKEIACGVIRATVK